MKKKGFMILLVVLMLLISSACSSNIPQDESQSTPMNSQEKIDQTQMPSREQTKGDEDTVFDPSQWGVRSSYSGRVGDSNKGYHISFPNFGGGTVGYGLHADQNDGTSVFTVGQHSKMPEITEVSELFPACFEELGYTLRKNYGGLSSDFNFTLDGKDTTKVGDYDIVIFTGSFTYKYDGALREHPYIIYATTLKSNGAYVYWGVYDISEDHSNGELMKDHIQKMAQTFSEPNLD